MTATRSRAPKQQPAPRGERIRSLGSARLPNGRAVLGALLVVGSGLGVYLAHQAATTSPDTQWIVAIAPITAGTRIEADQLGLDTMRLGSAGNMAFDAPDDVVGKLALESIGEGELIQRSDLASDAPNPSSSPARSLTISLPSGHALSGRVADGQLVDVLASGDTSGSTRVIARGALVMSSRSDEGESIGSASEVEVTLVLPDETTAAAVVDAHETGSLTLITASSIQLDPASASTPSAGTR